MDVSRQEANQAKPERRYREEEASRQHQSVEKGIEATMPLQIFSTDDVGGDPYNHTGRFKRMFR